MQERRRTIRIAHRGRVQYCPSQDLLPRDGQMADVSEQGAGLRLREPHQPGEQITVTMPIPGQNELLTVTGNVRWSQPDPATGRGHRLGLEWLPVEEPTRNRLQGILRPAGGAAAAPKLRRAGAPPWGGVALVAGFASALLGIAWLWIWPLQRENKRLHTSVQIRDSVIQHLERQEASLQEELGRTQSHLAQAVGEVGRLHEETSVLESQIARLQQNVERFQQSYVAAQAQFQDSYLSYAAIRQERELLAQHVQDLQQERATLASHRPSIPELRAALREALQARREIQEAQRRLLVQAQRELDAKELAEGNRGYIVGWAAPGPDASPKPGGSTLSIRVLEPEPLGP